MSIKHYEATSEGCDPYQVNSIDDLIAQLREDNGGHSAYVVENKDGTIKVLWITDINQKLLWTVVETEESE